jgi:hypothetical protein
VVQSGEHVPPKQMFKAFDCDSLTVPSCDKHNSKKSGDDQAVISAFLLPLHLGEKRYPLEPEIEKAIDVAFPAFERVKRNVVRAPFLIDPPSHLWNLPDLAYLSKKVRIHNWIRQLSAGIIYSGIGINSRSMKWSESKVWSPDWFSSADSVPLEYEYVENSIQENQALHANLNSLVWQKGWSSNPRPYPETVYCFDICIFPNKKIIIRHKIYNRYTWYVFVKATSKSMEKIAKKKININIEYSQNYNIVKAFF